MHRRGRTSGETNETNGCLTALQHRAAPRDSARPHLHIALQVGLGSNQLAGLEKRQVTGGDLCNGAGLRLSVRERRAARRSKRLAPQTAHLLLLCLGLGHCDAEPLVRGACERVDHLRPAEVRLPVAPQAQQ